MDRVSLVHSVAKFLQCVDPWIWEDAVKLEVVKPLQLNVVVSLIMETYFNGSKSWLSCLAWCVKNMAKSMLRHKIFDLFVLISLA